MDDELNGRVAHVWRAGERDRKEAVSALIETIASAAPLVNHNGDIVALDESTGQLLPIGRNALQELIGKHVAGTRIVNRDGRWVREYYTFDFAPRPRPKPPIELYPAEIWGDPDLAVLTEIQSSGELLRRLPRVVP